MNVAARALCWHGRQARQACPTRQGEQHGFGLVIGMLGQHHMANLAAPVLLQHVFDAGVSGVAGGFFGAFAAGVLGLHVMHHQGHLPARTQGFAVLGKLVGSRLQAMVDVHRPDLPRPALGASEQHGRRVGTATQGHHQGRQRVQGLQGLGQRVIGWGAAGAHPGLIGLRLWCRCSGRNFAAARSACRAAL